MSFIYDEPTESEAFEIYCNINRISCEEFLSRPESEREEALQRTLDWMRSDRKHAIITLEVAQERFPKFFNGEYESELRLNSEATDEEIAELVWEKQAEAQDQVIVWKTALGARMMALMAEEMVINLQEFRKLDETFDDFKFERNVGYNEAVDEISGLLKDLIKGFKKSFE